MSNQRTRYQRSFNKTISTHFIHLVRENWKYLLSLGVLVFVVYANSLNGAFISDDIPVIVLSKTIGTFEGAFPAPFLFLRDFFYFIIFITFGANPIFYHLLNISFHIGSVCVLFLIVKDLWNKRVALFASVLFSVHPIITESVSWISGGAYSQYSFFVLASFLFFIKSRKSLYTKTYYISSIVFFLLALISADKALPYPMLLLMFVIAYSEFLESWKKLIPYFMLSFIWGFFYVSKFADRVETHTFNFGNTGYGINPVLFVGTILRTYLQLLFWPAPLTIFHSEFNFNLVNTVVTYVFLIVFMLSIGLVFIKNRKLSFWPMFFVVSLGITLFPLKISWIVAERYIYLGSVGIFVLVAVFVDYILSKKKYDRYIYPIIFILICSLGIRTIIRNTDWSTEEKLWLSTVNITPSNPVGHSSLGLVYQQQGDLEKAGAEYFKSITLNPQYSEGYFHLGDVYRIANRLDEAAVNYQKSVAINPKLWQGYQALGAVYYLQKKYPLAITNTQKSVDLQKNNAELYINLGIMYYESGNTLKSQEAFEQALRIEPENVQAQSGLQKVMNAMQ